ncbi:MAG TPA: SMP-30/gluconolactonase/LRE family protein [Bryobacterales bacterium]|nr:SMP-30/gluconolactonase/LRE family protein [Bryobacterales bacterium]
MNQAVGLIILASTLCLAALGGSACSPPPEPAAQSSPAAAAPELEIAATITFTEGPTVYKDGSVFFTDTYGERIMKLSPDGGISVFRHPSNSANGLIFDAQWRLIACEGSGAENKPRLTRTNIETGDVEVIAESFEGKRLNQPNDVTFDSQGRLYFSDRPRKNPVPDQSDIDAVYRIDTDGSIHQILKAPDIDKPNGLVISPDDKTFYLIEAHPDENRARMIRAYDLQPDGSVANMRVFHDFYPGRSGDGMTIDSQGNLYVAAGLNRLRGTSETLDTKCGIHVFAPDGALKQFIPIHEDTLTNVAFGGPDLKTLYAVAGKTLFKFRTEIEGTRR